MDDPQWVQFNTQLPKDLAEQVRLQARRDGREVRWLVASILSAALQPKPTPSAKRKVKK